MNKENHLVEYKRELSETFERSVIAFLNSTGGHIYIGINDDGSVYGVKDMDHVQRQIADRILNNIKPNAIGLFEVVAEENRKPLNDQFAKTLELLTPDGKYNYNAYLLADENGVSIKVARYKGRKICAHAIAGGEYHPCKNYPYGTHRKTSS